MCMREVMFQMGKLFGRLPMLARWAVVLLIAAGLVRSCTPSSPPPKTAEQIAAEQKAQELAAEARAQEAAKNAKEEAQFELVFSLTRTLKQRMRDPDSFKIESAAMMSSGDICFVYRARNGFGGYNREAAVYQSKKNTFVAGGAAEGPFNQLCQGSIGKDFTRVAILALGG